MVTARKGYAPGSAKVLPICMVIAVFAYPWFMQYPRITVRVLHD